MSNDSGSRGQRPGGSPLGGPVQQATTRAGPAGRVPLILDQAFDSDSLYALRAAVAAHAAQASVPQARVHDLVVAVHELATNAVRHGAGHGSLRVWAHDGVMHCQVSDDGAARADGAASGAETAAADSWPAEHGHGLWLIRQVADQTSLRTGPGGTVATVSFILPGSPA